VNRYVVAFLRSLALVALPLHVAAAESPNDARSPQPPLRDRFAKPDVDSEAEVPDFQRHIVPLFGRLGCNGRACHGSFQGQGGFRLSMFGYDFQADLAALKSNDTPRVNVVSPAESLLLTKPTSDDDHGGGKRFDVGGWEYEVLSRWITAGANAPSSDGVKLTKLSVTPTEIQFGENGGDSNGVGDSAQLRVVAHWSDGTEEDVTCITRYATNDEGTAVVDADGRVSSTGRGSTYVIACYDSGVASVPIMRPVSDRVGPRYPNVATPTRVDELVVGKLRKLGIVPSDQCTDSEFLRRASLDVCGTLPKPAEIEAFLADDAPDKRARKIDELLERPEYAAWWTTLFCDLTGLNSGAELGGTDYAKDAGDQWQAWLHRRIRDNVGYDEIARGIVLAVSRKPGQSYDDYVAEQVSYLRKQDPADFSDQPWMPYYWFRGNLASPEDKALSFAHVFMGIRLDCAQCHKHPFDEWSQQDFKDFTALFERVSRGVHPNAVADRKRLEEELGVAKMKNAAERRQTFRRLAGEGKPAPFNEVYIAPLAAPTKKGKTTTTAATARILGGEPVTLAEGQDPREPVMDWLLKKDNPYFAPAFVNRVWAHYFEVGIVDPPDDFNRGNPPSNRELLEFLARDFVEHGYDIKHLHRTILNSRTYQLSWRPNETNRHDERLFSKAPIRRLPAEVTVDAVRQATAGEPVAKRPANPAIALAARYIAQQVPAYESRMDYSMLVFGKPIRKTNCDCERQTEPSLLQAVYLRNDADIRTALDRADGWLKSISPNAEPAALVREAYLRIVSRPPTDAEAARCLRYFAETETPAEALADVVWALLNTQEFITNH